MKSPGLKQFCSAFICGFLPLKRRTCRTRARKEPCTYETACTFPSSCCRKNQIFSCLCSPFPFNLKVLYYTTPTMSIGKFIFSAKIFHNLCLMHFNYTVSIRYLIMLMKGLIKITLLPQFKRRNTQLRKLLLMLGKSALQPLRFSPVQAW